jgi:cellulose synthase/poly-beta-1,6-N-acetylglucosamine synthase-like glycosyltransferase
MRSSEKLLRIPHGAHGVSPEQGGARSGKTIGDPDLTSARHGASAARNIGLAASTGEYLALLDADDVWFPGKLSVQTEILDCHTEVAVVYNPRYFWYS